MMNADILKGKWKEMKGEVKAKWGKLTDNDLTEIEGTEERLLGLLQKRYGYAREKAEEEYKRFMAFMDRRGEPLKKFTRKVEFEFSTPDAKEVYLVGTFNNWKITETPMEKDKKGIWKKTLSLEAGKYQYRFLVDGNWQNDPSCPNCVPNEFGSQNCVRIVG